MSIYREKLRQVLFCRIHPAILIFVNVILALVSIAALIGIWLGPG